jgi:hypothetical protein
MRTVWKYSLSESKRQDRVTISGALSGEPRHIAFQGDDLYVWIEGDTNHGRGDRTFLVLCTGSAVPDASNAQYIGSVTGMDNGHLVVLHVYEEGRWF